ncbi:MAG: hypothetical protein HYR94_22955, partial [Chloroflexi bacterium]|nr:hypothetical protein [Chloroflexota bacterium]
MIETTLPLDITHIVAPTGQLLSTKLYAPRLRANRVSRPRLITRLNRNLDQRKLTLLSAPTGFGKTTLLSEWLYQKDDPLSGGRGGRMKDEVKNFHPSSFILPPFQVAWLSLDKDDNDPVRFLTYIVAALQMVQPEISEASVAILHASQPFPLEAALTTLVNEIATASGNYALVLDDYHV